MALIADSHFVLLLQLRWRLFLNSLRARKRQTELAFQAIAYVLGAVFVLAIGLGVFFGTAFLLRQDKTLILDVLLWAIFLFWQAVPIMVEGASPGLSFREVARYPVSFRLYFLLNAAYGLFDPAAVAALLWLASIWLGILWARPEWALPAAGLLVVFAMFNVLCNRILMALLERFQSTRRGREGIVVMLLFLMLAPQLLNFAAQGWIKIRFIPPPWTIDLALWFHHFSPPGLIKASLVPGATSRLLAVAMLLGYGALLMLVQMRQLRKVYDGEIYADRFVATREVKIRPGWRLAGLDDKVSAIVEKELRYLRQNVRLIVTLVYPAILLGFMVLGGPARRVFSLNQGGNVLGAFAGLLALTVSNISYNTFGMDREGFGRWMLVPMSLKKVMLAKNIAQGAVMSAIYLLGVVAILTIGHVTIAMLVSVTAGYLALLTAQLGAGSLLSVYWPKRFEFTQMNSRMTSNASGLASFLVILPMAAVTGAVTFATWYWHVLWLPLVASLAGLVVSLKLYSYLLDRAVSYAQGHLEEIAGQLGV